ncbi:hypothetical protein ABIB62_004379 [Mucilaginibacter sp. UYP25]
MNWKVFFLRLLLNGETAQAFALKADHVLQFYIVIEVLANII